MLIDYITSRFFGRPVELYQFTYGPRLQDVVRYTDGEEAIVFDGNEYTPMTIQRGQINNSGTLDKSSMEINLPHSTTIPQLFRVYPPGHVVGLTIFQGDAADPDNQFLAIWVGRVLSVSFEGVEAKLNGEPVSTSFRRSGLRRNYQYMCPHVLYGPQCQANKTAATVPAEVVSVDGRQVVLDGSLTGPELYAGGMLEWERATGLWESRTILEVSTVGGNTALLLTGLPTGLSGGMSVSAVRGCRHTLPACRDDHNNANNYGGDPWIPMKNPIGNVSPFQ